MEEISWGLYFWLLDLININGWQALTEFLETQTQTFKNVLSIVGVIVLIIGLLQCFLGYKLFKIWCGIVGFFIGSLLAVALSTSGIVHTSPAADLISLLLIIFIGFIGALIAYKVYLVGLFLYAFFAFFLIGFLAAAMFTGSFLACLIVGIITGTAMGVLVVIYRRFWIILMSSIHGAMSVCMSLMMIMQSAELGFAFILGPVLGAAGFFVQYFVDKKNLGKTTKPEAVTAGAAPDAAAEVQPELQQPEPDVPVDTEIPFPKEAQAQESPQDAVQPDLPGETPPTAEAPPADAPPPSAD